MFEAFKSYALALKEVVMEKLPELFNTAKDLPEEIEEVKEHAKEEFEGLDIMKKGKALMNLALNIKFIAKIPEFIKAALEHLKADFEEMKEAVLALKEDLEKLGLEALKCVTERLEKPKECYTHTHGRITYTPEER